MMMKVRLIALILLVAGAAIGFFVYGSEQVENSRFPFRLGLDLSGGTALTYRADTSGVAAGEVDEAMSALRDVIERRVNLFGVSEPLVQVEQSSALLALSGVEGGGSEQRLIVELPGVTDVTEAVRLLGETPLLEFKLYTGEGFPPEGEAFAALSEGEVDRLYEDTGLTGRFLQSARLDFQGGGGHTGGIVTEPAILLEFNSEGADRFEQITGEHIGDVLSIFLDGAPITQPVIQSAIPGGTAVITGSFTPEEGRDLARDLNFGALPVPIELVSTENVGAVLGEEILGAGVTAGLYGFAIVILFLIFWYRLPGVVAALALLIYGAVILALFKLIPVTLTAAGIAGFILSLGIAVDANILVFERMKEELRDGKPLREAVRVGFRRAWLSIRDGNLSTLIMAVILFWFGTSLVEGFALVLGIGVLVSMLTALTVTRTFLLAIAPEQGNALFGTGVGGNRTHL